MSGAGPGARIDRLLESSAERRRPAIMTHIVFGYPSAAESERIVDRMARAGADLIEIQIPFSDPTADGPVITAACQKALDGGVRVADAMAFLRAVKERYELPFLFMTYLNIAFGYRRRTALGDPAAAGLPLFIEDAARAGASGTIIPDLPPDALEEGYAEACRERGIHPIYVVSPNVPDRRLELIRDAGSGFVYATSRTGTTGKEMALELEEIGRFLDRVRGVCRLPVAVGFSISTREQIEALAGHADIAVVGTHLIRAYDAGGLEGLERELSRLVPRG